MEEEDAYYCDFTTASELEIFIARLEGIILKWGLNHKPRKKLLQKDDFKNKQWCTSTDVLKYSEAEFLLKRYYLKYDDEEKHESEYVQDEEEIPPQAIQDMLSFENDFFPISHPPSQASVLDSHLIARWYGLRDFLILIPQLSSYVESESKVKLLLSSLLIAINNTKCAVPFFLKAFEPWQNYFVGVFRSGSFQTEFNMVHLKKTPLCCKFLTGLLTMFKSKIGITTCLNPVTVSVKFTYVLKDCVGSECNQEDPGFNYLEHNIGVAQLNHLPFGSVCETINELYLNAVWPFLLEKSVVDSENYSDLDPVNAPVWKISVTTTDNPSFLLTDHFTKFVLLTKEKHSIRELLGNLISNNSKAQSSDMNTHFSVLSESKILAFSKAVIEGNKIDKKEMREQSHSGETPISNENLMALLYYLFPDADKKSTSPYAEDLNEAYCSDLGTEKQLEVIKKKLSGMKSAPFDSLLWRLSLVMAHVIHSLGGVRSAAYLWYEFIQELRFRCERGILVPGLDLASPDSRTCLLNQKLQLLNCCISKQIERKKKTNESHGLEEEDSSDSEEEFFDCSAEVVPENEETGHRKVNRASSNKPVGRLSRHGNLKLLETGEPLYIPVTQDPGPKTSDQLEEDTQVLLQLGTDAQSSELRAKLMSASLLSDMEAFKAANPGCILADFIRWYSPRDWIEDHDEESTRLDEFGQRTGRLSMRMEIPGNLWMELWKVAQSVPAKWQKKLFDDEQEAEKVLDFLERRTPKEFVELLMPVMIMCVTQRLLEEAAVDEVPEVEEILSKLIREAVVLMHMTEVKGFHYEKLITRISEAETALTRMRSLKHKFMPPEERASEDEGSGGSERGEEEKVVMEFVKGLLTGEEVEVPGGPKSRIRFTIRQCFLKASKAEQLIADGDAELTNEKWNVMGPFSSPQEKEMILRLSTPHGPQRLHAFLKKNETRLCGAFTRNVYFP